MASALDYVQQAIINLQAAIAILPANPVASPVPLAYPLARTDRNLFPKPPLQTIGPAGSSFVEPMNNLAVLRVTDRNTQNGVSFRTPSDCQLRCFNADKSMMYVVNTWGNVLLFDLNWSAFTATLRVDSSGQPVTFPFQGEPDWHPTQPTVLIGSVDTGTFLHLVAFDVNARTTTLIVDLQTLTTVNLEQPVRTYSRSCGISKNGATIRAIFAGAGQDYDHLALAWDTATGNHHVLDTLAGTLDGTPVTVLGLNWGWHLHAAWMDASGRYLSLATANADLQNKTLHLPPIAYWDIQTGTIIPATGILGGHVSCGYGNQINQASGGSVLAVPPTYSAAQWLLAALTSPGTQQALVTNPLLTPGELYADGHSSWHNAQAAALVPFFVGLYRYTFPGGPNPPLPALLPGDEEILAVQSNVPQGASGTVWRFLQHRTDPRYSTVVNGVLTPDPTQGPYFWASPRPQVSLDGLGVAFTSNMEQTLGIDPHAEPGGNAAQDVFLVKLVA